MMAKLFAGYAYTGSWAWLDEFNRINIEVLSFIAQQLITIRNAMLTKAAFFFDDKEILLNTNMGIFVTMNPGYKGRTELPDNLKVLFRPVSMMIPDYALIAEIMLFSEGFAHAKPLSMKMTKLYKLASEQLSQQKHYDFGMRAVKSVLVMAGQLKRQNQDQSEEKNLIQSMIDSNIPKFIKSDIPLIDAIVKDLFPGLDLPSVSYEVLIEALTKHWHSNNLEVDEKQVHKILQFYETMKVRFGIMIVGEAMSGKTVIYNSLFGALNYLNSKKFSLTSTPELKNLDLILRVFLLTSYMENFLILLKNGLTVLLLTSSETLIILRINNMMWIIFDGPVDAGWIENMNTVLDDNMTLWLSNGERIKLNLKWKWFSNETILKWHHLQLFQDVGWFMYHLKHESGILRFMSELIRSLQEKDTQIR